MISSSGIQNHTCATNTIVKRLPSSFGTNYRLDFKDPGFRAFQKTIGSYYWKEFFVARQYCILAYGIIDICRRGFFERQSGKIIVTEVVSF